MTEKFGRWTVIKKAYPHWQCRCDCGTVSEILPQNLKTGGSKSCGCLRKELLSVSKTRHGHAKKDRDQRTYIIWSSMRSRCNNPKVKCYSRYGGRGISICEEWNAYEEFFKWASANGYSDNLELDRIDNDGNYSPDNCRWVTHKENSMNRRSTVYLNTGEKLRDAADRLGLPWELIYRRLWRGWDLDDALSRPRGARK